MNLAIDQRAAQGKRLQLPVLCRQTERCWLQQPHIARTLRRLHSSFKQLSVPTLTRGIPTTLDRQRQLI